MNITLWIYYEECVTPDSVSFRRRSVYWLLGIVVNSVVLEY